MGLLWAQLPLSTQYHLQFNGQMEWVNQILEQYLCCFINYYQHDRISLLLLTELNYNSIVCFSLQQIPLHAQYGFHPCDHPATLAAIQVFSPEDSLERLQCIRLCLPEQLEKAKEDFKGYADRYWQPA